MPSETAMEGGQERLGGFGLGRNCPERGSWGWLGCGAGILGRCPCLSEFRSLDTIGSYPGSDISWVYRVTEPMVSWLSRRMMRQRQGANLVFGWLGSKMIRKLGCKDSQVAIILDWSGVMCGE